MSQNRYPQVQPQPVVDTLCGVTFPDRYRGLESSDDAVSRWQDAQNQLARQHARQYKHHTRLKALVSRYHVDKFSALPRFAAGKWFALRMDDSMAPPFIAIRDGSTDRERILFSTGWINAARPPFLSWFAPSPDGKVLAVGLCFEGNECNQIRLIEAASGRILPDGPLLNLKDNWTGGARWLPDSSGFFVTAMEGSAADFNQQVFLCKRTPDVSTVRCEIPWRGTHEYRVVIPSPDGRHAIALERLKSPIPVAIGVIENGQTEWRPFITSLEGTLAGHLVGDRYVAITDVGAPRGRVVSIDCCADEPEDITSWDELVAESEIVLRRSALVDQTLYLSGLRDTYAQVLALDLETHRLRDVALPQKGAVLESYPEQSRFPAPLAHPHRFVFAFSSLTTGPTILSHAPATDEMETLESTTITLDGSCVEEGAAFSKDGARIPYHLVSTGQATPKCRPTLICGYGGFNAPFVPRFLGALAAFVEAGGVVVHAHLRGGGEFGKEWWESGRLANKQNTFDDLYAVAEHLIASGVCNQASLGITGASNGGLLSAVALTQRPDLWGAAIPRFPILDLIGACRDIYAAAHIQSEFADVRKPDEVRRLASFSPYHLVRPGVSYPAVYIDAGEDDPRCPPWHARKFAAALQDASASSAPIVLRVWSEVGHGWTMDRDTAIAQNTEWLAFTLNNLGHEWAQDHEAEDTTCRT